MAASGIQEHNEARRKQMHMERLAFLHKMLNDKYKSTYETELNDRTRINYDPLCREFHTACPYFCREEPANRTGREMPQAPPIGFVPEGFRYVYNTSPQSGPITCHHNADYFPQDRFRISYDYRPNTWAGRSQAYTVPIGYRPDERSLVNLDFNPRPGRDYTYMTQARSTVGTDQYTPYSEMFSAKLPKRFTTNDYLMQW